MAARREWRFPQPIRESLMRDLRLEAPQGPLRASGDLARWFLGSANSTPRWHAVAGHDWELTVSILKSTGSNSSRATSGWSAIAAGPSRRGGRRRPHDQAGRSSSYDSAPIRRGSRHAMVPSYDIDVAGGRYTSVVTRPSPWDRAVAHPARGG
ncbi:hypothetical protein GS934_08195 [Rhodococcus hoagii]|nr:hypothetical protein [Prescottella equi]NKZ87502.1 hypothetical protein [Prescottella equi]